MKRPSTAALALIIVLGFAAAAVGTHYAAQPAEAAGKSAKKKVAKKGPGKCGTYMYWKAGKCNDARAKK